MICFVDYHACIGRLFAFVNNGGTCTRYKQCLGHFSFSSESNCCAVLVFTCLLLSVAQIVVEVVNTESMRKFAFNV